MKKLNYILLLQCLFLVGLIGCEEDDAQNPVFGDDEQPRIFGWSTDFIYTTNIEDTLRLDMTVSPSDGVTYEWLVDDEVVSTEQDLEYIFAEPKSYTLKFVARRNNTVTNSREAEVIVIKPFEPKAYNKKMIGFLTKDGSLGDINFNNLTHLVISSAVVGAVEGQASLVDTTFADMNLDLIVTAAHNAGVYVMLDVTANMINLNGGGYYGEKGFYNLIAAPETRAEVIATVMKFASDHKLDGVNIYLNNYSEGDLNAGVVGAFFNEISAALPEGPGPDGEFFYSASVPGGWTTGNFAPIATIEEIDWINLQPYRYESLTPADHSPMWGATDLVATWKGFGASSEKLVIGFPAFGLRYDMPPEGTEVTWGNLWMYATYISYKDILAKDPEAHTKNQLNEADGIFYDGHPKIEEKAQFVLDNDLGGLMLWSLENDVRTPGKSLLEAANSALDNPSN